MLLAVVVAPIQLTLWVLAIGTAVIVVLIAIAMARHLEWVRADRRREYVRVELEPVFSRFLKTEDTVGLAEELRPAFLRMDAAHRPVAAVLVIDMMREAPRRKGTSSGTRSRERASWSSGKRALGGYRRGDGRSRAKRWGLSEPSARCRFFSKGLRTAARR